MSSFNCGECCPPLFFISLVKTGTNNLPLAGATFELRQGTTVIQTVTSGTNGIIEFDCLLRGNYTLVETVAPAGYELNTTEFPVTILTQGDITINGVNISAFELTNTPITA